MGMAMPQTTDTRRSVKSESAFRTISEVSEELDVPQHVLRFWETKFAQIRPMKRGGGRRYYRPEDVALLQRIRTLLYTDGFTIKGVQKLLREGGAASEQAVAAVAVDAIADHLHEEDIDSFDSPDLLTGSLNLYDDDDLSAAELYAERLASEARASHASDLFADLSAMAAAGGLTPLHRGVITEVVDELSAIRDLLAVA